MSRVFTLGVHHSAHGQLLVKVDVPSPIMDEPVDGFTVVSARRVTDGRTFDEYACKKLETDDEVNLAVVR